MTSQNRLHVPAYFCINELIASGKFGCGQDRQIELEAIFYAGMKTTCLKPH